MIGVLGHVSALHWSGTTWANEMNFVMKHAPSAGLIGGPVDQQSSMLRLCYGWLLYGDGLCVLVMLYAEMKKR